ncbi:FAD dependent oxidoreductase [Trametes elegans]|nr:FAD dependent oxidoreductase [Trametes elegans]
MCTSGSYVSYINVREFQSAPIGLLQRSHATYTFPVQHRMPQNIVIVGGGIIGCTTAYYLASHPRFNNTTTSITLIEASKEGVAQGASGKAGGLVAKWAYPKELVNVSFPEHVRLAEEHNGKERWGWRFVNCGNWEGRGESLAETGSGVGAGGKRKSLEKTLGLDPDSVAAAQKQRAATGLPEDLNWVKPELTEAYAPMAPAGATAQVHPYLFTTSMLELAKERGVKYVQGRVTAVNVDNSGSTRRVSGVTYTPLGADAPQKLAATHVVLAAGAWSPRIVPSLPISGTRAHSITIRPRPGTRIAPYVLFTEIALPGQGARRVSPEIYARPTDEVYCCGPGDDSAVPDTVDDVQVDEAACTSIHEHVASISRELREGEVDKRQACFLPVVSVGGGPIVGEAGEIAKGLVIATGHTCWGICNAPGTGKAIAELILEGKIKCGNLNKLKPSHFL